MADRTKEERNKLNGYKPKANTEERKHKLLDETKLTEDINWVEMGGVTSVKNQG